MLSSVTHNCQVTVRQVMSPNHSDQMSQVSLVTLYFCNVVKCLIFSATQARDQGADGYYLLSG